MLNKKETERLGLLGKKITYKDPMTGKMRTVEIDAENCGVFSKEEEERVFYTRRNSKVFSETEETKKYWENKGKLNND